MGSKSGTITSYQYRYMLLADHLDTRTNEEAAHLKDVADLYETDQSVGLYLESLHSDAKVMALLVAMCKSCDAIDAASPDELARCLKQLEREYNGAEAMNEPDVMREIRTLKASLLAMQLVHPKIQ